MILGEYVLCIYVILLLFIFRNIRSIHLINELFSCMIFFIATEEIIDLTDSRARGERRKTKKAFQSREVGERKLI